MDKLISLTVVIYLLQNIKLYTLNMYNSYLLTTPE